MSLPITPHRLRDRLRSLHATAVEKRLDAARSAAEQLLDEQTLAAASWDDIRAVYDRPDRSPIRSYSSLLGSIAAGIVLALSGGLFTVLPVIFMAESVVELLHVRIPLGDLPRLTISGALFVVVVMLVGFMAVIGISLVVTSARRVDLITGAPARDADATVTAALDLMPSCATLDDAPAGADRTRALEDVFKRTAHLAEKIDETGGLTRPLAVRGDTGYGHTRKVRAALAAVLDGLLIDRPGAARTLARYALTIATAQAQSRYGALLDEGVLPDDPGEAKQDGRSLLTVFLPAALAAGMTLVPLVVIGVSAGAILTVPIVVFVITAIVTATATSNLHRITDLVNTARGRNTP